MILFRVWWASAPIFMTFLKFRALIRRTTESWIATFCHSESYQGSYWMLELAEWLVNWHPVQQCGKYSETHFSSLINNKILLCVLAPIEIYSWCHSFFFYPTTLNFLLMCSVVLEIPFPALHIFCPWHSENQWPVETGSSKEIFSTIKIYLNRGIPSESKFPLAKNLENRLSFGLGSWYPGRGRACYKQWVVLIILAKKI